METRMIGSNKHLSILTLNVNGFSAPIKRHIIATLVNKQDPTICCLQETHLLEKTINTGFESKAGKKFSKQMDAINRQE
jgi:exonuclease III